MLDLDTIPDMFEARWDFNDYLGSPFLTWNFSDPHPDADRFLASEGEERDRIIAEILARPRPVFRVEPERSPIERRQANEATYRERNREDIKIKARKRRAMKNLKKWEKEAKLIVLGRELATRAWEEILTNPASRPELEAFADFVYLLHHRGTTPGRIAKMLQTNVSEIKSALAGRGIVT